MDKFQPFVAVMLLIFGYCSVALADQAKIERCIVAAAQYRNIDPKLLKAIAIQESRMNPLAISKKNKDGTVDVGLFQINEGWLPKLRAKGITREQLFDGCISSYVAAWILAHEIKTHGPTWRAVGAYNSPTETNRKIYASRIQPIYTSLSIEQSAK